LAAVDVPGPLRLVVSGILAGGQEAELLETAKRAGLTARRRLYEGEWVTVELTPGCGTG
jgi:ribosomal protein L11 methylase PrmA